MTLPARVPWYLSIGTRLLATTTLLIAVIVGAVLWQWATSAQQLVRDQAKREGQAVAQTLALALTELVADENWNQARIVVDLLVQRDPDFVYVIVTDVRSPQIALAFPADQEQRFVTDLVRLGVSQRAMEKGELRFTETVLLHDVVSGGRVAARGEKIIEVAQDLRFTGDRFGVVRIGISLRRAEKTITDTLRREVIGVAASLALAMIAAYFMSTRITRPVIHLAELMDGVGGGDLERTATVKGNHEIAHLGHAYNQMLTSLRQKRVLEKYVPMGARKDIAGDTVGRIELGGRRRRCAILFSDLRGFTSMSERLEPPEVVALLNEYLEIMTVCIAAHGGDINEYVGDAILAVFHCDDGQEGALAAVRAAWDMQIGLRDLKKKTLNEEIKKLSMGIGIHVGDIIEGNIGSRDRVKYGVVGDAVNLAARIQDRSRDGTLTYILVSDAARQDIGAAFSAVSLGELTFKGKSKPVVVWEIDKPEAPLLTTP